jgi:predicted aspartyl protease
MSSIDVIPFTLVGGDQPLVIVPVDVMGRGKRPFVLDTGASRTVVDAAVARSLGLVAHTSREGHGIGGRVAVELARAESLTIGARPLSGFEVVTTDLTSIAARIGGRVDGVLGHDVFGNARLEVDYPASVVHFEWTPETRSAKPDEVDVPFKLAGERKPLVMVQARVNGLGPYRFAVDTGASTTLVTEAVAEAARVEAGAAEHVTGAGGGVAVRLAVARRLTLGPLEWREVGLVVADLAGLASVIGPIDGILGYNVMKDSRVTFDYPARLLRLAPH